MARRKKEVDFFDAIIEEADEEIRTGRNTYQALRDLGAAADILRGPQPTAKVFHRPTAVPGRVLDHPQVTPHGYELEIRATRE